MPGDSLAYFGETAVGKRAFPVALGACLEVAAGVDEPLAALEAGVEDALKGGTDPASRLRGVLAAVNPRTLAGSVGRR